jgi:hypothetical protein
VKVDAIIVGREANARRLAGTARLWLAGTRVFSPSCVVIPATGAVYVLANTNEVAPNVPNDHLYGVTWNPAVLEAGLAAIPGLADARVVAVDGMNPAMFALLGRVAPHAQFVAFETPHDQADASATELAQHALAAMERALAPGVGATTVRAAFYRAIAAADVTTPAFDPVATKGTWFSSDEPFAAGDRVILRAGVMRDGHEGVAEKTVTVGAASG